MNEVIPHERIEKRIHELRGKKVMLTAISRSYTTWKQEP